MSSRHSHFIPTRGRDIPIRPAITFARDVDSASRSPVVGAATNPRTARPQPPKYLGGEELALQTTKDRREAYAAWLTAPKNPFFARSLVNRLWSYFFHRGIIEPVDDIRGTNPPINPALLDALAKDFTAHRYDTRHLMRRIVLSEAYQRSSRPGARTKVTDFEISDSRLRCKPVRHLDNTLTQQVNVEAHVPARTVLFLFLWCEEID